MAHRARYAAAMAAITRRLPFGLSEVIEPNMVGYLVINLCTFFIDLSLLAFFHGHLRWPIPVAVTCSYGTASVLSYVLNRVLNFRSHADVGRQFPVYVAVSLSNYLIFVLGLTDLLSALGVYYELSRVLAACCEGVYLYCMLRWVVFRDVSDPEDSELSPEEPSTGEPSSDVPSSGEPSSGEPSTWEPSSEGFSPATTKDPAAPVSRPTSTLPVQETVPPEPISPEPRSR